MIDEGPFGCVGVQMRLDAIPAATAMYCLAFTEYEMTPPPIGSPVEIVFNTLPVNALKTKRLPLRSPVTSNPDAVTVTPAIIGVGDWYFQRTFPVVASMALTHPWLTVLGVPNE
jgi:hypothetical protein